MIKKVKIIPWCISCRNCELVCPGIFKVDPKSKVISNDYEWKEFDIIQAELMCPVNVIKVEKEWNINISFKKATLLEKQYLTKDTLELVFKTKKISFKPWQYIILQGNDLIWKFSRSYSIAKINDNKFTLTVKILKKWRWSTFLKKIKIWKNIQFLWPIWNFYLQNTNNKKIFIATWTWLAPIIAMLEASPKEIEKTVIFWVRNENDIYYKDILEQFQNTKVIIKVSKPSISYKWEKWRVTDNLNEVWVNDEVYICGNPEMVNSVKNILIDRGHFVDLIFNESFSISREYKGLFKDIFFEWNIPWLYLLSWIVIIFSLFIIPITWYYNAINNNLYWNFLFISNFMWFLFDVSRWSVFFVMIIRPLADLFPKIWLFTKLLPLRRSFWILSASIIVTNLFWNFIIKPDYLINYFKLIKWWFNIEIIARLSEITAILLLVTSNDISQRKLWIWWKRIQRTSYIYFICGWIVAWLYFPFKIYTTMTIVIILWVLAHFKIQIYKKIYKS